MPVDREGDGLRSPTAFCTDLKRRVLECQKFAVPLTLVLLDIDDFKPLVDNLGTSARELVVSTMSEFLTMSLHDIDVVSHYGDGHFAIMMPGTELAGAIKMADRLRSVISSCALPVRGEQLRFTISLGLAQAQSSDDPRSLVKRADAARTPRKGPAATVCTNTPENTVNRPPRWPPSASWASGTVHFPLSLDRLTKEPELRQQTKQA